MNPVRRPYTYLRFDLRSRFLDADCRARLERLGIECVQEAGPHRAYGIVADAPTLADLAARDPQVNRVEIGAPPVGF